MLLQFFYVFNCLGQDVQLLWSSLSLHSLTNGEILIPLSYFLDSSFLPFILFHPLVKHWTSLTISSSANYTAICLHLHFSCFCCHCVHSLNCCSCLCSASQHCACANEDHGMVYRKSHGLSSMAAILVT